MIVVFVLVGAVAIVVIGLVVVGRETASLATQPKQTVFDLEEAVDYVADRLPDEVTAKLTYDDVRSVLRWHLEYLRERDVPRRRDKVDGLPAVVEDDEGIAYVLVRTEATGLELTDLDVAVVLEVALAYYAAIGSIGGEADPGLLLAQIDPADEPPALPPGDGG